jgi:hypothetical protein
MTGPAATLKIETIDGEAVSVLTGLAPQAIAPGQIRRRLLVLVIILDLATAQAMVFRACVPIGRTRAELIE